MNYKITSWQKLHPNVYDVGGKIVAVRRTFLTTPYAMLLGGGLLLGGAVHIPSLITEGFHDGTVFGITIVAIDYAIGCWFIAKGIIARKVRKESGGIHPTDTIITLDPSSQEVRQKIGDAEERITTFSEMQLFVKSVHSKNTKHFIRLTYPGHTHNLAYSSSIVEITELLADIRTRLGLPPEVAT